MNGSRARKLRHKALGLTVGKPKVEYEGAAPLFLDSTGMRVLKPDCTRAVYQKLKKEYITRKNTRRG